MKRLALIRIALAAYDALLHSAATLVVRCLDPQWARPAPEPFIQDAMRPALDEWSEDPMGGYEDHEPAEEPSPATLSTPTPPPPPVTILKATCVYCSDIDVPATSAEVVIFRNALHLSWYGFTCPQCTRRTIRSAASDETRALLLRAAGAHIVIELVPAEALEEHPNGLAITNDDLLDAHLWLQANDDLAALAGVIDVTDGGAR
ncbi:hypothetical protein [Kineosporia sp. R_H_3]|uniref:hypothetical protein n=1 Tax=Kineosporia sp. R_H_3 TaxID=1961848 RepID=UPI000B4BB786|nr:hypothetical protein [Kineosporia sp. R_H_3]